MDQQQKPGETRAVEVPGGGKLYVTACPKCFRQVAHDRPGEVHCTCGARVELRQ